MTLKNQLTNRFPERLESMFGATAKVTVTTVLGVSLAALFAPALLAGSAAPLITFVSGLGGNLLAGILQKIAERKPATEDEVLQMISTAVEPLLSQEQFHAEINKLNEQVEFLPTVLQSLEGNTRLLELLRREIASQKAAYGETARELLDGLNDLSTKLDGVAATVIDIPERVVERLARVTPADPADLALDIFGGRVVILTDDLLSHPADAKRVQQFYAGAKLDWDIVAAQGDIPRDQQEELLKQASQSFEGMRLICVVGEAGAGKSTLAWHVAAELHQQHEVLVIHIKDGDDPDMWYGLAEFHAKLGRPFCVLVDDIFHDPDAAVAFHDLSPWLPISVLATSRRNEYRARRLKCETVRQDLKPPSPDEKERILKRLGKSRSDLTAEQQRRLDSANQFLVLMMEITQGKDLHEIVRDSIERLRELDEPAYRAYEYLCFAYQHSVAMPASLLERLDARGRFHNLPEHRTADGMIFWDSREGCVRVGHPVIAETAAAFYAQHRSPQVVLTEIAAALTIDNAFERRFLALLLRVLAQIKSSTLTSLPAPLERAIANCFANARSVSELNFWQGFYRCTDRPGDAERCGLLALDLDPASAIECQLLLHMCRGEGGREQDALPAIAKWVRDHPKLGGARATYLGLIERYGTPYDVERVLQETSAWLADHSEDHEVRERYLALVKEKGTPGQVAQVLQETSEWLREHSQDVNVREAFLGLVEAKGSDEFKEVTIAETKVWLDDHPTAQVIWDALIAWLFRLCKKEEALEVVSAAIQHHPNDQNIRGHFLRGAQHTADKEAVKEKHQQMIAGNPNNIRAQFHFAAWLRDHDCPKESETLYQVLVEKAPERPEPHYGFAKLLLKLDRFGEAAKQFREVLRIKPEHRMAHDGLGEALSKSGEFDDQAEQEFRSAIYFAGVQNQPQAKCFNRLGSFYLDHDRWKDAIQAFESARNESPEYYGNYLGIGKALMGMDDFAAAMDALRTAQEKEPNLQPPASEEIGELLAQCQRQLDVHRTCLE